MPVPECSVLLKPILNVNVVIDVVDVEFVDIIAVAVPVKYKPIFEG